MQWRILILGGRELREQTPYMDYNKTPQFYCFPEWVLILGSSTYPVQALKGPVHKPVFSCEIQSILMFGKIGHDIAGPGRSKVKVL
jgi:hypothetical protein